MKHTHLFTLSALAPLTARANEQLAAMSPVAPAERAADVHDDAQGAAADN